MEEPLSKEIKAVAYLSSWKSYDTDFDNNILNGVDWKTFEDIYNHKHKNLNKELRTEKIYLDDSEQCKLVYIGDIKTEENYIIGSIFFDEHKINCTPPNRKNIKEVHHEDVVEEEIVTNKSFYFIGYYNTNIIGIASSPGRSKSFSYL